MNNLLTIDTDGGGNTFNIRVYDNNGFATNVFQKVDWHPLYTRAAREQFENALQKIIPQCKDNPIEIGPNLETELDRLFLHVDPLNKTVIRIGP